MILNIIIFIIGFIVGFMTYLLVIFYQFEKAMRSKKAKFVTGELLIANATSFSDISNLTKWTVQLKKRFLFFSYAKSYNVIIDDNINLHEDIEKKVSLMVDRGGLVSER